MLGARYGCPATAKIWGCANHVTKIESPSNRDLVLYLRCSGLRMANSDNM